MRVLVTCFFPLSRSAQTGNYFFDSRYKPGPEVRTLGKVVGGKGCLVCKSDEGNHAAEAIVFFIITPETSGTEGEGPKGDTH